ncbi:MAG TPA: ATP-dependent helicase [Chondromyces sp.]|nr:ATP-dependent helicase [Chondromyces sp.]
MKISNDERVIVMQTKHSFSLHPSGKGKQLRAELAEQRSIHELVNRAEEDSAYFQSIERRGVSLNAEQIEAVRTTEGPLLALAGAGSGKTSLLTARTGYMLAVKKIPAEHLLLLTFTKKAAEEMKERVRRLPGITPTMLRRLTVGTFHSVFLKILYRNGFGDKKLLTSEQQKQIAIKTILKELNLKDEYDPETLLSQFSYYKNTLLSPEDLPSKSTVEKEILEIYRQFELYKQKMNMLDFDDILFETYRLLKENENLTDHLRETYQYILIDEFQDSSPAQYEIIKLIAKPRNNLMVVGDDDQTIYQFRGSHHRLILDFPNEFPQTKIVTLSTNYRSNPAILGLGNEVIGRNEERFIKRLKASHQTGNPPLFIRPDHTVEEASILLDYIQESVEKGERNYRDYAVLYRTHAVSRALIDQLVWKDIPFTLHNHKEIFYENRLVKPILDHLRLAHYPDDLDALSGICSTLYLSRDKIMNEVVESRFSDRMRGIEKPALHYLENITQVSSYQRGRIKERVRLIQSLKKLSPYQAIEDVRYGEGGYEEYLKDNKRTTFTLHKDLIQETLDELSDSAKPFKDTLKYLAFIERLVKKHTEMKKGRSAGGEDAISLFTIHGAKGLEFPVVFLIGASDGILPHHPSNEGAEDRISEKKSKKERITEAIEEERRLMYVAITRAKEELFISSPKTFRNRPMPVSRFLKEVYE